MDEKIDSQEEQETKEKKTWGYWTVYENNRNLALSCISRADFKRHNASAYRAARKNGWLEDYYWFRDGHKIFGEKHTIWTYSKTLEKSKEYSSRKEFCEKCVGGYTRALKQGWLDDFTWLKNENVLLEETDSVYAYFFMDNSVYVGRTLMRTQNKRHGQHCNDEHDTVYKHAHELGILVPEMKIIEEHLTVENGSKREGYWVDYFLEQGYTILNKQKTGGLGGLGRGVLNRSVCYSNAQQCQTLKEFYENFPGSYRKAGEKGWINDYIWLKSDRVKRGYWQNKENCLKESRNYQTRKQLEHGSPQCYQVSRENGWLDEMTWLRKPSEVRSEARKLVWKKKKQENSIPEE